MFSDDKTGGLKKCGTLFSKDDSNKLRYNVKNKIAEMTLIYAKFVAYVTKFLNL